MTDVPDEVQRWTAQRRASVVMAIVKGESPAAEAACRHGLTVAEIERWKAQSRLLDSGGWRPRRRVLERGSEPVAICQIFEKSIVGLSCVMRIHRGPLFLGTDQGVDVVEDVYQTLRYPLAAPSMRCSLTGVGVHRRPGQLPPAGYSGLS